MLNPATPFPYPGSYALLVDLDAPAPQADELVRINWRREGWCMVSFPLRDGASGNKTVAFADLIDATPLTGEETREYHDIDRALFGREPRNLSKAQRQRAARRDALKRRIIYAPIMARLLREARGRTQREAA